MPSLDTTVKDIQTGFLGATTRTWSHTCTGSNLLLVFCISLWQDTAGSGSVTSCSYNSVALTQAAALTSTGQRAEIWYLMGPATGSNTFSYTTIGSGTDALKGSTSSFTGVVQTTALDTTATQTNITQGGASNPHQSLTTGVNNALVVGCIGHFGTTAPTTNSPFTNLAEDNVTSTMFSSDFDVAGTAGSVTLTYTDSDLANDWALVMASFKPAAVSNTPPGWWGGWLA